MTQIIDERIPNLKPLYDLYETLAEIPVNFCFGGGCIQSMLSGEKVKDVDLFSANYEETNKFLVAKGYTPTWSNAKLTNYRIDGFTVQVIDHPYRDPLSLIAEFDFTIACSALTSGGLYVHDRFFQDLAGKRLVFNKITFPLSSLERVARYSRKGFVLCPVGLQLIAKALNSLVIDWDNPDENVLSFYPDGTLRFQGVD